MKKPIIFTLFIFVFTCSLAAQEISDVDLKTQLMVELLRKDVASKGEVRSLEITELKYNCSIPLTFGIYKYDFSSSHKAPGLFVVANDSLLLLTDYKYKDIFQNVDRIFQESDIKYEDRLIYLSKIFGVLYQRVKSSNDVLPDSLINLNPKKPDSSKHKQR